MDANCRIRAAQLAVIVNSASVVGAAVASVDDVIIDGGGGISSFWDADVCVTVTIDLEVDKIFLRHAESAAAIVELVLILPLDCSLSNCKCIPAAVEGVRGGAVERVE